MEKDWIEIQQPQIPDEVRQVELPEIGETTPHPKPESPQASQGSTTVSEGEGSSSTEKIGFIS
ncbi:hypothetical protein BRE01_25700 [Brevibacillus reuszeri]|uniref:Uncharacterized protein n=1 Tax=Brevibacillus reuszeri TaxID=54915 RepID=A0A0K9YNP0_9BACL|nr:hypothetical protein [Brevibacillus reuszeri]KNB69790.1 hypothetical protein ADS79_28520 [Brevibacillus reuszeri]MED1858140.1 hypothetical protein [Brevibacillus reuszeri]GED68868.1 hypothetical protein BRE01_25700 [Brevibacillus reuszeri]